MILHIFTTNISFKPLKNKIVIIDIFSNKTHLNINPHKTLKLIKKKLLHIFPNSLQQKFPSINQNHDLIECLLCSTEEIPFFRITSCLALCTHQSSIYMLYENLWSVKIPMNEKSFSNFWGFLLGKYIFWGLNGLKDQVKLDLPFGHWPKICAERERRTENLSCLTQTTTVIIEQILTDFPKSSHYKSFRWRLLGRKMWQWQWQNIRSWQDDVMGIEFFELLSLTIHRFSLSFGPPLPEGRNIFSIQSLGAPIICLLINKRIIFSLRLLLPSRRFLCWKNN